MNKFFIRILIALFICFTSPAQACAVFKSVTFITAKTLADAQQIELWSKQLRIPIERENQTSLRFMIDDPYALAKPGPGQTQYKIKGYAIPAHIRISGWGTSIRCQ